MRDHTAPPLVQEVYSSLLDFTAGDFLPEDSALTDKIEQWRNEFSRMRVTLVFIDKLVLRVSATNAERKALKAERKILLHEKAQNQQALMAKEQALQKLRDELLTIHQSWLWRRTMSLKRVLSFFQKRK
jgi:hypothetical protein